MLNTKIWLYTSGRRWKISSERWIEILTRSSPSLSLWARSHTLRNSSRAWTRTTMDLSPKRYLLLQILSHNMNISYVLWLKLFLHPNLTRRRSLMVNEQCPARVGIENCEKWKNLEIWKVSKCHLLFSRSRSEMIIRLNLFFICGFSGVQWCLSKPLKGAGNRLKDEKIRIV